MGADAAALPLVGDGLFAAAFLLDGMVAAGRLDALSHWVASDHFEELGRPPRLFHGGFGLLTVGNLRKPRCRALALAARLGDAALRSSPRATARRPGVDCWPPGDDGERRGAGLERHASTSADRRRRRCSPAT